MKAERGRPLAAPQAGILPVYQGQFLQTHEHPATLVKSDWQAAVLVARERRTDLSHRAEGRVVPPP
jgi:hypothetical protein